MTTRSRIAALAEVPLVTVMTRDVRDHRPPFLFVRLPSTWSWPTTPTPPPDARRAILGLTPAGTARPRPSR
eukprot:8513757-Heterocapsa_arctica.AAC.1